MEGRFCPEATCRQVWSLTWQGLRDTGPLGSFGAWLLWDPQQRSLGSSQDSASPSPPGPANCYALCFFTPSSGQNPQDLDSCKLSFPPVSILCTQPPLQTALVSWLLIPHFKRCLLSIWACSRSGCENADKVLCFLRG